MSVNFGKNTPTKILSASEFKNTAFTIAFGTLNNNNFSALATNDASATSS
ncbi:hypothetical protein J6W20_01590 [bacterium]|nr:hypothetical protein [bacterium]